MRQYDVFDGKTYLFTVSSEENPFSVLEDERRHRPAKARLRLEMLENGIRTEAATAQEWTALDAEFEEIAEEWDR